MKTSGWGLLWTVSVTLATLGLVVPSGTSEEEREPLPEVAAERVMMPPEIDGSITDAVWQNAPETRPFVLADRPEPAVNRTTARIAVDDEALYLAFDCQVTGEKPRRAFFTERDAPVFLDDCVEVLLSPTGDPENYFHFAVNSLGAPYDAVRHPVWGLDSRWDGAWRAAAAPRPGGWTAEIALPLAMLVAPLPAEREATGPLGPLGPSAVWRMNLGREAWQGESTPYLAPDTTTEASAWSCPYGWFHTPDRLGRLTGVTVPADVFAVTAELLSPPVLVPGFNVLRWRVINRSPEQRSLELQVHLGEAEASRYCRVPAEKEAEVEMNLAGPPLPTERQESPEKKTLPPPTTEPEEGQGRRGPPFFPAERQGGRGRGGPFFPPLSEQRRGETEKGRNGEYALSPPPRLSASPIELQSSPEREKGPGREVILQRLQVSLRDRGQKQTLWQEVVPVQVRPALRWVPDRSYYTTEERAYLRLDLAPSWQSRLDLSVRLSVPDRDGRPTTCWEGNTVPTEPVVVNLTPLPVGTHLFRATLRASGELVERTELALRKLPPAEHPVQVDGNRRLLVDGYPFFPLGFYGVAREERHYRLLAETGFNTVVYEAVPEGGVQDDFASVEAQLDLLHRCGLKSIVDFSWSVRGPRSALDEIQRGVERLRTHPAVLAWEIVDEPHGFGGVALEELQQAYDLIRQLDPYHPIFVNLAMAGYSPLCFNALDVLGRDPYPIPREPVGTVASCVDEIRRGSGELKPLWITLQAFEEPPTFTRPTFMQARAMTYLALLRGADALLYFLYGYPGCPAGEPLPDVYPSLWGEFPRLAREIPALLPILAAPYPPRGPTGGVTVETDPPGLEWQVREYQGRLHILTVNATPQPLDLTWRLPPEHRQAHVAILFGQAQWELEEGAFHDVLDSYATRVYVVQQAK